jgi:hypothetical protein
MKNLKTLFAIASIGAFAVTTNANASIINGSFETGLTGWTTFATASTSATATAGTSSAIITAVNGGATNATALESFAGVTAAALTSVKTGQTNFTTGSAIKQVFSAAAGDTFSFDYRTLTNEAIPSTWDFTFVVIDGVAQALGDTAINSGFSTGVDGYNTANLWNTFDLTFATSGLHTVTFGALQAGDNSVATALLIDNVRGASAVPEPTSIALLGLGLLGMAAGRRKSTK